MTLQPIHDLVTDIRATVIDWERHISQFPSGYVRSRSRDDYDDLIDLLRTAADRFEELRLPSKSLQAAVEASRTEVQRHRSLLQEMKLAKVRDREIIDELTDALRGHVKEIGRLERANKELRATLVREQKRVERLKKKSRR